MTARSASSSFASGTVVRCTADRPAIVWTWLDVVTGYSFERSERARRLLGEAIIACEKLGLPRHLDWRGGWGELQLAVTPEAVWMP